jgi:hypothetical protein
VRSFTKELLPPHLKETLTLVGLLLKRLKIWNPTELKKTWSVKTLDPSHRALPKVRSRWFKATIISSKRTQVGVSKSTDSTGKQPSLQTIRGMSLKGWLHRSQFRVTLILFTKRATFNRQNRAWLMNFWALWIIES